MLEVRRSAVARREAPAPAAGCVLICCTKVITILTLTVYGDRGFRGNSGATDFRVRRWVLSRGVSSHRLGKQI